MTREETHDMLKVLQDAYGSPYHVNAENKDGFIDAYHRTLKDKPGEHAELVADKILTTRTAKGFPVPGEIVEAFRAVKEDQMWIPKDEEDDGEPRVPPEEVAAMLKELSDSFKVDHQRGA